MFVAERALLWQLEAAEGALMDLTCNIARRQKEWKRDQTVDRAAHILAHTPSSSSAIMSQRLTELEPDGVGIAGRPSDRVLLDII